MASITLNSSLLDALAPRGTHIEAAHRSIAKPSQPFSSANSIASTSYIAKAAFASQCSGFISRDLESPRENSTSGEITTEDEENSLGENSSYFCKRSSDEFASSVKKRRKQTKPVRVQSMDNAVNNRLSPANVQMTSPFDTIMKSTRDRSKPSLACPHCSLDFVTEDALRRHIIEDHIGRILNEDEGLRRSYALHSRFSQKDAIFQADGNDSFSEREEGEMTPLNLTSSRWENKNLQMDNGEKGELSMPGFPASLYNNSPFPEGKFDLASLVPLGPPPFMFPFLHQRPSAHTERERLHPSQQPLKPVSNGHPQIFNLEAYCDLCNKEFCNKYFLKTHKANKHGVYNIESGSPQLNSNAGLPPQFSPITSNNSFTSVPMTSTSLPIAVHQTSPLSSIPLPGSPFPGPFIPGGMPPLSIRPMLPSHLHSFQRNSLPIPKGDGSNISKNGIISIEAYCEICQKEFCNKYFLKRHKSKIHNIDIEVTIKNITKSPQDPKKPGFDRPEGWCDACRKDIGSRSALNSHKLNIHGPHVVMHLLPSNDMQNSDYSKEEQNDHQNINDNFSPWDVKRSERSNLTSRESSMHDINERTTDGDAMEQEDEHFDSDDINNIKKNEQGQERIRDDNEPPTDSWNEDFIKNGFVKQYIDLPMSSRKNEEILIKKEPNIENNPVEEQENNDSYSINQHDLHNVHSNSLNQSMTDSFNEAEICNQKLLHEKHTQEIFENNQLNRKDIISSEPHLLSGGGSSTDENSRELGLIARVGQPAIAQVTPGTKHTAEQLRQLGVVNADAFCELCCKEFCNKYFLRTHKIKKHGIYTPEYSDRSKQTKESPPINLASILERQVFDLRPGLDMDLELECDACMRTFPNLHLLSIHKYCIHGPGQDVYQQQEHLLHLQNTLFQQDHMRSMSMKDMCHLAESKMQFKPNGMDFFPQKTESAHKHNDFEKIVIERNLPVETALNLKTDQRKPSIDSFPPCQKSPLEINRVNSSVETATDLDTSEDLRKLQTMILELNRQGDAGMKCKVCQKELGNIYSLRAHLMTEHGILPECHTQPMSSPRTSREPSPHSSPPSTPAMEAQGFCTICKRDFFSRYILQQHMLSAHGIFSQAAAPTSFLDRIRAEIENKDDRKPISTSRSYCEICNKELCNKYFMKTHMLKMHGINIENGSSGGVTCDVCRKDLCSKYFLKVHKQNTHGLVEEISESEQQMENSSDVKICPLCTRKFKNIKWLQTHLNSDHGEEGKEKWAKIEANLPKPSSNANLHVCGACGQEMPDLITLQIHYIKHHGMNTSDNTQEINEPSLNTADESPTYQCSICSMVLSNASLLCAHEKTHTHTSPVPNPFTSQPQIIHCPLCSKTIPSIELYQQHLIQHQLEGFLKPFLDTEERIPAQEMRPDSPQDITTDERKPTSDQLKKASTPRKRWRCSECGRSFKSKMVCLTHIQTNHGFKSRHHARRRLFKCRKCGATARKLSVLRAHMKRRHPAPHHQNFPTARAHPTITAGQFVMQPFLLNKEDDHSKKSADSEDSQTFVPSLVYLPVAKKIQHPLTVSFCLTPA